MPKHIFLEVTLKTERIYRSKNIPYGLGGVVLSISLFYLSDYLATAWLDLGIFICGFVLFDILFGFWSLLCLISGLANERHVNNCLRDRFGTTKEVEIESKSPVLWGDGEGLYADGKFYSPSGSKNIYLGTAFAVTDYHSIKDNSHVTLVTETVLSMVFVTCFEK